MLVVVPSRFLVSFREAERGSALNGHYGKGRLNIQA
jgi:hypothetical protein